MIGIVDDKCSARVHFPWIATLTGKELAGVVIVCDIRLCDKVLAPLMLENEHGLKLQDQE